MASSLICTQFSGTLLKHCFLCLLTIKVNILPQKRMTEGDKHREKTKWSRSLYKKNNCSLKKKHKKCVNEQHSLDGSWASYGASFQLQHYVMFSRKTVCHWLTRTWRRCSLVICLVEVGSETKTTIIMKFIRISKKYKINNELFIYISSRTLVFVLLSL